MQVCFFLTNFLFLTFEEKVCNETPPDNTELTDFIGVYGANKSVPCITGYYINEGLPNESSNYISQCLDTGLWSQTTPCSSKFQSAFFFSSCNLFN